MTPLEEAKAKYEKSLATHAMRHDWLAPEAHRLYSAAFEQMTAELQRDLESVNAIAREYGFGQGELDEDLAGCLRKVIAQERHQAEVYRLELVKAQEEVKTHLRLIAGLVEALHE